MHARLSWLPVTSASLFQDPWTLAVVGVEQGRAGQGLLGARSLGVGPQQGVWREWEPSGTVGEHGRWAATAGVSYSHHHGRARLGASLAHSCHCSARSPL